MSIALIRTAATRVFSPSCVVLKTAVRSHTNTPPPRFFFRPSLFAAVGGAALTSALGFALYSTSQKQQQQNAVAPSDKDLQSMLSLQPLHCRAGPQSQRQQTESNQPIYRVVLTGGPCGGKTTAISTISEQLKDRGFNVYVVPEAATMLMTGGVSPFVGGNLCLFEESIMRVQMALEDVFYDIASSSGKPSILLCDRGMMDSSAYVSSIDWQAILDRNGWTNVRIRDGRYDAVIHLITAAIGAEAFYTTANNTTRLETVEEAAERDLKTREAWMGHPHLRVIDNSTNFSIKIARVVDTICQLVGLPSSDRQSKRKYLLASEPNWSEFPVPLMTFQVEQTFLNPSADGSEISVSRRGQTGSYAYSLRTVRQDKSGDKVIETELKRKISSREYVTYLSQKDTAKGTVRLTRRCFLWQNSYYVIDSVYQLRIDENGDIVPSNKETDCVHLMRVEMDEHEADSVKHPSFTSIQKDVTTDSRFKFAQISTKCQK
eukprot:TRINITY_DN5208_c0_g1_i1.p1 TRINITY_DN5208_c0_g1~~TRINITY_DN5208_c0_g1_i1.p1  ORF type:complete len:489 (+),score=92.72 TRINITY_DN5208_c0_g1_i1:45-1511(+)